MLNEAQNDVMSGIWRTAIFHGIMLVETVCDHILIVQKRKISLSITSSYKAKGKKAFSNSRKN